MLIHKYPRFEQKSILPKTHKKLGMFAYFGGLLTDLVDWAYMIKLLHEQRLLQRLSREQLTKLQERKLQNIIRHAYNNVKMYRTLFKRAGISPDDVKTIEDLKKMPIIDKKTLRSFSHSDIVTSGLDVSRCLKSKTSGSTGEPFVFIFDRLGRIYNRALHIFPIIENGLRPWHKLARLQSARYFPEKSLKNLVKHHFRDPFGFVIKQNYISLTSSVEKMMIDLVEFDPDAIYGWPSLMLLVIRELMNQRLDQLKPKLVFSTSELLDNFTRNTINSTFEVKMFDLYGATEHPMIAWECSQHEGYHINVPYVVLELIADNEPVGYNKRGEVVITNLYNYAMPLIRYRLGDIALASDDECSCGRKLPLLKMIEGRLDDFLVLPDGRVIQPMVITNFLYNIPSIKQYKVVQEKQDYVTVYVNPDRDFKDEQVMIVREKLRKILSDKIEIEVRLVDSIVREKRRVVSKICSRYDIF